MPNERYFKHATNHRHDLAAKRHEARLKRQRAIARDRATIATPPSPFPKLSAHFTEQCRNAGNQFAAMSIIARELSQPMRDAANQLDRATAMEGGGNSSLAQTVAVARRSVTG